MYKSVKSRAEEQFAATQKKDKQFLKDKDSARQERTAKQARLRALRLAKEAAETGDSEAPSSAQQDLPEPELQGAIDKDVKADVKADLLEIPPNMRR